MPLSFDHLVEMRNRSVWLEYRYPEYNSGYRQVGLIRAWFLHPSSPNRQLYGITWRCWEKEPSAEEMLTAEWEELRK